LHPKDFREQALNFVAQLGLEEKTSLLSGSSFWDLQPIVRLDFPAITVSDGPHGLRTQDAFRAGHLGLTDSAPATCFPTAVTLASSWDEALVREVAEAIGHEAQTLGVSVVLGPGVNIKRSPLCGRNFEYFSEDPFLSGRMAAGFIQGVQSKGIGTSIKHFAANNQEGNRMVIDTQVDERTLREIYLPAFEIAVRESQPWTVMHAYNRLNGVYCGENDWLLGQVLRDEWGFEGLVVSDWGATNDRVAGVRSGMDLEMPASGGLNDTKVAHEVVEGSLDEALVDRLAGRVVELMLAGQAGRVEPQETDFDAHQALAERAAVQGAVLLKNQDQILPLKPSMKVVVVGAFAEKPRFQGAGSSQVNAAQLEAPLDRLRAAVKAQGGEVVYLPGYDVEFARHDPALIADAVEAAKSADAVLVLAGLPLLFESEGFDRSTLDIPSQINALISAVAAVNPRTVVALSNGSPVLMPWLGEVAGVLELYLAGQAGAGALARLVFGEDCPSGKLAETFPLALEDVPAQADFADHPRRVVYREGLNVGYRYFTTYKKPVLFPFGFGLSYTKFSYGKAQLDVARDDLSEPVRVTVAVTNTGDVRGAEIVQFYVRQKGASVFRPDRELKGFAKLCLDPGETGDASISLDRRAFAFWDDEAKRWRVEPTDFEIIVGASSEEIRAVLPFRPAVDASYNSRGAFGIDTPVILSDEQLCALGLRVTAPEDSRPFSRNSTMAEIRGHWLGRRIYAKTEKQMRAMFSGATDPVVEKMGQEFLKGLPLRALQTLSSGALTEKRLDMIIALLNGHWITALRSLF
jgi:beta-glucosidase